MRVIIAGSRHCCDDEIVELAVRDSNFDVTEVISGGCRGIDSCAIRFASNNDIPLMKFNALWHKYGRKAGPFRNEEMAEYGEALIAIPGPGSRGTYNMIHCMKRLNKPIYVYQIKE